MEFFVDAFLHLCSEEKTGEAWSSDNISERLTWKEAGERATRTSERESVEYDSSTSDGEGTVVSALSILFPLKNLCITVPSKFVGKPFCFERILVSKSFKQRRGEASRFCRNFFYLTGPKKLRQGTLLCFRKSLVGKIFYG